MDAQTRQRYMKAMGILVWSPRLVSEPEKEVIAEVSETVVQPPTNTAATISPLQAQTVPISVQSSPPVVLKPNKPVSKVAPDCSAMGWGELQANVQSCERCDLAKTRTQTVFGVGNQQADWLIVGEAPGAEEDRRGEPFVGKAGQLLNSMLMAIGLPREAAYIMNVLKCRPPNNRDPKPEEAAACRAYLERQLALLQPKLILVVGRVAAQNLLQTNLSLGRMRGKVHELPDHGIPVIVTYHPAYLLRKPSEKRKVWQDLKMALQQAKP